MFAATGCAVVVISATGLLAIELAHPHEDVTDALSIVWDVTALLLGVVAGYLLARHGPGGNGRE